MKRFFRYGDNMLSIEDVTDVHLLLKGTKIEEGTLTQDRTRFYHFDQILGSFFGSDARKAFEDFFIFVGAEWKNHVRAHPEEGLE